MALSREARHTVNRGAGLVIPVIIIAVAGYSIYVFVFTLCVEYLLKPPREENVFPPVPRRPATAIALIITYFLLFALAWLPYFRFLGTVYLNPGYIPKGRRPSIRRRRSSHRSHDASSKESISNVGELERQGVLDGTIPCPAGIEEVVFNDIYQCDPMGLPLFCDKCWCWKPNRTHHCSEIGRCVRRMDHFCPWVGGVVAETNMKFFLQFTVYCAIWLVFLLSVMIWACVQARREGIGANNQWYALLGLAVFFLLMTSGMSAQFIRFGTRNLTTVDEYKLGSGYQYFAFRIPLDLQTAYRTITYPLPRQSSTSVPTRRFCVVQSQPGQNPWDLESRLENMKTLMGNHFYEWLLPITYSPFCKEEVFGTVVGTIRKDFGLTWRNQDESV